VSVAQRSPDTRGAAASPRGQAPRARPWTLVERTASVVAPTVLVLVLCWPMLLRTGDTFGDDWSTHLWFVWHASEALQADHRPSLFVQYGGGAFYPHFAFYGGTLYTVTGLLSAALGDAQHGYALSWVLAFAAAYGGWVWLGRMAGLGRWSAQAPAVVFVTSPYLITTTYVRGDWPELVAVSAMPLVAASALSVLRADRLRLVPGLALAGSAIVFSGSHNITLLWGATFLVLLPAVLCLVVPAARRQVTRAGALRVLAILVPAVLVNAWFLLPDVVYQADTMIAGTYADTRKGIDGFLFLVGSGNLFSLSQRTADPDTADFVLALPVLAMAWVLLAGAATARQARRAPWWGVLAVLAAVTAALLVLMTHAGLVLALPRPYVMVQFTYRLESYILLGVCGALLVALVLLRDAPRRTRAWTWVLVPIVGASLVTGIAQVDRFKVTPLYSTYDKPFIPSMGIFASEAEPDVGDGSRPTLAFPAGLIRHDRVTLVAAANPGQVVDTNLLTMPALVHVEGAQIIGRRTGRTDQSVPQYHAVLRIDRDATPGAARITVSAAHPPAVVIGRVLSVLGILALLANFALLPRRRRRARRTAVDDRPGTLGG
jgi:hypothetical protein